MFKPGEMPRDSEIPKYVPDSTGKNEIKSPGELINNLVDSEDNEQGRLVEIRSMMRGLSTASSPVHVEAAMNSVQKALSDVDAVLGGFEYDESDEKQAKLRTYKEELEKQKLTLNNLMQNK